MLTVEIEGYPQKKLFFAYQTIREAFNEAYPNIITALEFKMKPLLPLVNYSVVLWDCKLNASANDAYLFLPLTLVDIYITMSPPSKIQSIKVPSEYKVKDLLLFLEHSFGITKIEKVKSNIVSGYPLKPEDRIFSCCWVQCD